MFYFDISEPTFGQSLLREAGTREVIILRLKYTPPSFSTTYIHYAPAYFIQIYEMYVMNVDYTIIINYIISTLMIHLMIVLIHIFYYGYVICINYYSDYYLCCTTMNCIKISGYL